MQAKKTSIYLFPSNKMFTPFILAKHLHEASKHVMQNRLPQNGEMEPDEELHEVSDSVHYDTQGRNGMRNKYKDEHNRPVS